MKLRHHILLASLLVAPLCGVACSGDEIDDDGMGGSDGDGTGGDNGTGGGSGGGNGEPESVTLTFRAQVGDEPFACGESYGDQGSSGTEVTPSDLRFYVSDLRLITDDGTEVPVEIENRTPWQAPTVALLDFEDASGACKNGTAPTNAVVTGTVPPGDYVGVAFSPAVPLELNHEDPATLPDPLQAGGMTWGWLFGYKFIVAELVATELPDEGEVAGAGIFHLGSTGCDNTPPAGEGGAGGEGGAPGPDFGGPPAVDCASQNRTEIRFEEGFSLEDDLIVVDIGAMMQGADLSVNTSCHGAGDCESYFETIGLDYESGEQLGDHAAFRVESK